MAKKLLLTLLTSFLLAMPWLGIGGGFTLLVAFVPLFILQSLEPRRFGLWVALSFALWIVASAWWVSISTIIAAFAVPMVGLFFCWIPFWIFNRVYRMHGSSKALPWVIFVTSWITFEVLYMSQDISFPWLTLGYGFASAPWAVQWYELTGSLGGSLWILVSNVLCYMAWHKRRSWIVVATAWIVLPLSYSVYRYVSYDEPTDPLKVCVLQPNIDPYTEKFSSMSQQEQLDILLGLSRESAPETELLVAPETALNTNIWIEQLDINPSLAALRHFIRDSRPGATIVVGATTLQLAAPERASEHTVQHTKGGIGYEIFNSALWIDSSSRVDYYHKSKLVIGTELIPVPALFEFLRIDLGGIATNLGRQPHRTIHDSLGVAICYESIYGEYFTEYVARGARAMTIITNDGWWGNTAGHHHHLNYARLRAVETRRSIARSANTGISAIINQRGDVEQRLDWDERGVINGTINYNSPLTPYVLSGDVTGRLAIYVFALCLLYAVGLRFRKKH